MRHGIDAYFDGLARDRTRLARIGIVVALLFLVGEFALHQPGVRAALNDPKRFGFEGPEQYARHILLEQIGLVNQPGASAENVVPIELHAGGGKKPVEALDHGTVPGGRRSGIGPGDDEETLVSRMRAMALEGPVIRSEDLVAEHLERPEYPEEARAQNIEGLVELVALVDTTGDVTEVHIIGGTHQPMLEQSATDAALQCRYRAYGLTPSAPQRVWAYFRIRFTLY
jgi:TonB family protein